MSVKIRVNENSELIGKTRAWVEENFGLRVVHLLMDYDSRTIGTDKFNPDPLQKFKPGNYLIVEGAPEEITKLATFTTPRLSVPSQ